MLLVGLRKAGDKDITQQIIKIKIKGQPADAGTVAGALRAALEEESPSGAQRVFLESLEGNLLRGDLRPVDWSPACGETLPVHVDARRLPAALRRVLLEYDEGKTGSRGFALCLDGETVERLGLPQKCYGQYIDEQIVDRILSNASLTTFAATCSAITILCELKLGLLPGIVAGAIEAGSVCGLPALTAAHSRGSIAEKVKEAGSGAYLYAPLIGGAAASAGLSSLFGALKYGRSAAGIAAIYPRAADLYIEMVSPEGKVGRAKAAAKTALMPVDLVEDMVESQYSDLAEALGAETMRAVEVDTLTKAKIVKFATDGEKGRDVVKYLGTACSTAFFDLVNCKRAVEAAAGAKDAAAYAGEIKSISKGVVKGRVEYLKDLLWANIIKDLDAEKIPENLKNEYDKIIENRDLLSKIEETITNLNGKKGSWVKKLNKILKGKGYKAIVKEDGITLTPLKVCENVGGECKFVSKGEKRVYKSVEEMIKGLGLEGEEAEKVRQISDKIKRIDTAMENLKNKMKDIEKSLEKMENKFKDALKKADELGKVKDKLVGRLDAIEQISEHIENVDSLDGLAEAIRKDNGELKNLIEGDDELKSILKRAGIDLEKKTGRMERIVKAVKNANKFLKERYRQKSFGRQILESAACAGAGYLAGTVMAQKVSGASVPLRTLGFRLGDGCMRLGEVVVGWCSGR